MEGKISFHVNDVQTKQKNIKSTPTEKYQSSVKILLIFLFIFLDQ